MTINISSNGDWPANVLSNFAATPFVLDGIECASAEGFIQALKFSDSILQRQLCTLVGREAKVRGRSGTENIIREQKIWWQGQTHGLHSPEHFALVERGLTAKFSQNELAYQALLATCGKSLKHDLGYEPPHTSLPATEFIRILNRIRSGLLTA